MSQEQVDPQFYWDAALAYDKLENYEKAEQSFKQAYSSLNQNKEFLKNYIYFLRESGERVVIKTVLSEYLVLDPSDGEMLEILEAINTNY